MYAPLLSRAISRSLYGNSIILFCVLLVGDGDSFSESLLLETGVSGGVLRVLRRGVWRVSTANGVVKWFVAIFSPFQKGRYSR